MYIDAVLLNTYQSISLKCVDSNRVFNVLIHATKDTIKTFKCRSRCWLLNKLKSEGVGTNEVEHGISRMCSTMSEKRRGEIKNAIMRNKVGDAYRELRDMEKKQRNQWKVHKQEIPTLVRNEYMNAWREFMRRYGEWLKWKKKNKVEWLVRKWKVEEELPNEIRGINIQDTQLEEEFSSEARTYGGG